MFVLHFNYTEFQVLANCNRTGVLRTLPNVLVCSVIARQILVGILAYGHITKSRNVWKYLRFACVSTRLYNTLPCSWPFTRREQFVWEVIFFMCPPRLTVCCNIYDRNCTGSDKSIRCRCSSATYMSDAALYECTSLIGFSAKDL